MSLYKGIHVNDDFVPGDLISRVTGELIGFIVAVDNYQVYVIRVGKFARGAPSIDWYNQESIKYWYDKVK